MNQPLRVLVRSGDPDRGDLAAGLLRAAGWTVADADPDAAVLVLGRAAPVDPDAVAILRAEHPDARVVILAPDDRRSGELRRLLRAGADAVVFDAQAEACLAITVRAVHSSRSHSVTTTTSFAARSWRQTKTSARSSRSLT